MSEEPKQENMTRAAGAEGGVVLASNVFATAKTA